MTTFWGQRQWLSPPGMRHHILQTTLAASSAPLVPILPGLVADTVQPAAQVMSDPGETELALTRKGVNSTE